MSVGRFLQQAAAGNAGGPSDDDFANVVLLLDGDGTSGDDNETFTDSSTNGFTVTENGDVVQGSFSPYGDNWSNYFDGSSYLTVPNNSAFAFGTGDFTIEFWFNTLQTSPRQDPFSFYTSTTGIGIVLNYDNNQDVLVYTGNTGVINTSGSQWSAGVWNHLAVARNGTTLKAFINGTEIASVTNSSNFTPTSNLYIGSAGNGTQLYTGYLSNVRVIKGTAIYTGSFTPSTSPLTNVTNTSLLTCQSNRFIDNSSSSHTISVGAGTPKVTPFSPFKNDDARDITTDGGSAYFEYGATNALSVPADTNLDLSTGDFTVEMWVYLNSKISDSKLYMDWSSASNYWQFVLHLTYGWVLLHAGGTYIVSNGSASNVNVGEWQHLALTRSGNNFTIWQNGESFATGTSSANLGAWNAKNIGGWTNGSANSIDGYISDFRLTKGTALYSSSFTPPTSPISAGANTELFLKFQDAVIYDRSGINNLDTVGNAQIDTAVTKYGTGSIEFDGSGDYLLFPSSEAFGYSTGDFTLECWVYKDANPSADAGIIEQRPASTNGNYPMLGLNSSGQLFYYVNAAYKISASASTALSNQAWDHVAYVRSGGNLGTLYINGTSVGTWVDTTDYVSETPLRVGEHAFSAAQFNGFIDDLRITKGVARYTANFTPPTAALPKF